MDKFMGHDDREQKFEQALTRHLRGGASAGNRVNEKNREAGDRGAIACPDAELLAAFHERMLPSDEMNAAKEHIAECSRCQQILAHLEATDEIEVQAEEENVLTMREPVLAGSAGYEDERLAQVPVRALAASVTETLKAPREIAKVRGARTWRWVAPAGAIAAGLLIWVVVRDNKPQTFSPVKNIEMAQEQTAEERPAPTMRAPEAARRAAAPNQFEERDIMKARPAEGSGTRHLPRETQDQISSDGAADRGMIGGVAGGRPAAGKGERADKYLHEEGPTKPSAPARPAGSVARQGDVAEDAATPPAPANSRELKDKKAEDLPAMARRSAVSNAPNSVTAGAAGKQAGASDERDVLSKEKLDARTAAASATSGAPRAQPGTPPSEPAPTVAKQSANASQTIETHPDGTSVLLETQQVQATSKLERTSSALKNKTADIKTISAPGGTVLWQLRPTGKIDRSADSGVTWSRQNSGTTLELLAGSAPSEAVCWIVGRSGTILRTTDGGGHWSKVVSPIAGDVSGIWATDATHAGIFDVNSNARFTTNDGGATWFLTTK
jgi:hypothetical protein